LVGITLTLSSQALFKDSYLKCQIVNSYRFESGIPTDSLVAYYPFNGDADDESGNGHDGTVYGATLTTDRDGNSNSAYDFDGINDYIEIPDDDDLSFGNGSEDSPFSISIWINMDDATDFVPFGKDGLNREYVMRFINDKIYFYLLDNSLGGYIGRLYNTPITSLEGNWIHVVATYNGSGTSEGIGIYLNESRVDDTDSEGGSYTAMENLGASLMIGLQEIGVIYSNGSIDDIRIYNRVLTAEEIESLYNE
jgi:hypothetical protein